MLTYNQLVSDKRNIVVIDDEPSVLMGLRLIFKTAPEYHLVTEKNPLTAYELIKNDPRKVTLILLDLVMPGIDGLELLSLIKKEKTLKNIPIIIHTALCNKQILVEAADMVQKIIFKPYPRKFLLEVIRQVLSDNHKFKH